MINITDSLDAIKARVHTVIMATDPFTMLRFRRKEIATALQELREQIAALENEDQELATAERVVARFGSINDEVESAPSSAAGKPEGTPTTPNMILALLKEAHAQGKAGLEPKEMQISISKRWWPSVKSEDIGPTAWRMWKDGRLAKDGPLYRLPVKTGIEEAAGRLPWEDKPTASE